jgi:NADPH:quinone reductase-like Zn-dependent oxidoreductase
VKAAIVAEAGKPPVYGDFSEPAPAPGKIVVRVRAAALTHLTKGRASGSHYSAQGNAFPFVPGVDGAGTTQDGSRVYFLAPQAPYGAMAEYTLVDDDHIVPIPEAVGYEAAAALANPGMSSWAALVERAHLRRGETVLINGATGISGRLAIQIAKHLGAAKVIATGRNAARFDELRKLGADDVIPLTLESNALARAFEHAFEERVDVVLDYVWGESAEKILAASAKANPNVPMRFVNIGSMSAAQIALPAAALRSSQLELMGSGIGSVSLPNLLRSIRGVLEAAPSAGFEVATRSVPLADIAGVWSAAETDQRVVLRP